jgi:hypothetical protein
MAQGKRTRSSRPSDGDMYRWIRANRGSFAIEDALRHSDRDADFDERIAAAMRMSAEGRQYFAFEGESAIGSPPPRGAPLQANAPTGAASNACSRRPQA